MYILKGCGYLYISHIGLYGKNGLLPVENVLPKLEGIVIIDDYLITYVIIIIIL